MAQPPASCIDKQGREMPEEPVTEGAHMRRFADLVPELQESASMFVGVYPCH